MSAEWKTPEQYVQLVTVGGFVFDISVEQAHMVRSEMTQTENRWGGGVEFEDIYGAPCVVRADHIVGFRTSTPESCENYKTAHADDDEGETWI